MSKVCVITGGGSGMGLDVAKLMGSAKVVITGRTVEKLQKAVEEIKAEGIDVYAFACFMMAARLPHSKSRLLSGHRRNNSFEEGIDKGGREPSYNMTGRADSSPAPASLSARCRYVL